MKFSVSIYSFFPAILKGRMTPLEAVEIAAELGFDAVEAVDFVNFSQDPETWEASARELKTKADACGLAISSFATGADFLNNDRDQEVAKIKRYVDLAALMGAPRMRHDITQGYPKDSGRFRSYDALLPQLADTVREITEYAQTKGVLTMTENHGFFSQDSERVEKLYNAVNHPNFALLCDMGNFLCADENPALAAARVAPYVKYVHAKDFVVKPYYSDDPGEGSFRSRAGNYLRGTIVGHGNVPVKQVLHVLKAAGYDDTIAIEFEGVEDPETAVRIGLANLKRYWEEA